MGEGQNQVKWEKTWKAVFGFNNKYGGEKKTPEMI